MIRLTRRQAIAAGAALPLAAATGPVFAASEMKGPSAAMHNRFKLGGFEVTTLLAGSATRDAPQSIFGMNASAADFAAASAEAFLPTDKVQFYFTPTIVNTGSQLILFDTGLNPKGITSALAAAGYTPDQVDTVVITHMHGDHISGLSGDAGTTFGNASYVAGSVEHNHWSAAGNERFDGKVKPLNDRFTFIEGGAQVASGITSIESFGHTPGHMAYRIESEGKALILIADLANHPVWSLARPDWEVKFDMDKATAAASRKALLGQIADERLPMIGYHMPFPAVGYVERNGEGYRYVPHSYQLLLG